MRNHAGKDGGARRTQAKCARTRDEYRVDRMIRAHDEIGRDHTPRIAFEAKLEAIGQKADAGERRDREDEREHEHRQLAGAPIARRHAGRLPHEIGEARRAPRLCAAQRAQSRLPPKWPKCETMCAAMPR
jgi:hypothetical protein